MVNTMYVSQPVSTDEGKGSIVQLRQEEVRVSLKETSKTAKWFSEENIDLIK